ncbi:MAG TPA: hypothetical protein VK145_00485 [Candidatus Nanoarchaeia archaeon]|nr:hypothetical protein [Candidatus Nanoarchaeia archaeon]
MSRRAAAERTVCFTKVVETKLNITNSEARLIFGSVRSGKLLMSSFTDATENIFYEIFLFGKIAVRQYVEAADRRSKRFNDDNNDDERPRPRSQKKRKPSSKKSRKTGLFSDNDNDDDDDKNNNNTTPNTRRTSTQFGSKRARVGDNASVELSSPNKEMWRNQLDQLREQRSRRMAMMAAPPGPTDTRLVVREEEEPLVAPTENRPPTPLPGEEAQPVGLPPPQEDGSPRPSGEEDKEQSPMVPANNRSPSAEREKEDNSQNSQLMSPVTVKDEENEKKIPSPRRSPPEVVTLSSSDDEDEDEEDNVKYKAEQGEGSSG